MLLPHIHQEKKRLTKSSATITMIWGWIPAEATREISAAKATHAESMLQWGATIEFVRASRYSNNLQTGKIGGILPSIQEKNPFWMFWILYECYEWMNVLFFGDKFSQFCCIIGRYKSYRFRQWGSVSFCVDEEGTIQVPIFDPRRQKEL